MTDLSPDGSLFLVTSGVGQTRVMPVPKEAGADFAPVKVLSDSSGQGVSGAYFVRGASAMASASKDNTVMFWGRKVAALRLAVLSTRLLRRVTPLPWGEDGKSLIWLAKPSH